MCQRPASQTRGRDCQQRSLSSLSNFSCKQPAGAASTFNNVLIIDGGPAGLAAATDLVR